VSQSEVKPVFDYIKNQEKHQAKKTYTKEYVEFLNAYNVDFKDGYLFDVN
jgi:putative transposase